MTESKESADSLGSRLNVSSVDKAEFLFYLAGRVPISVSDLAKECTENKAEIRTILNTRFQTEVKLDTTNFLTLTTSARKPLLSATKPLISEGVDAQKRAQDFEKTNEFKDARAALQTAENRFTEAKQRLEAVGDVPDKLLRRVEKVKNCHDRLQKELVKDLLTHRKLVGDKEETNGDDAMQTGDYDNAVEAFEAALSAFEDIKQALEEHNRSLLSSDSSRLEVTSVENRISALERKQSRAQEKLEKSAGTSGRSTADSSAWDKGQSTGSSKYLDNSSSSSGKESETPKSTDSATSGAEASATKFQDEEQESSDTSPHRAALIREIENLDDRWSTINRKLIYSVSDYDPEEFEEEFGSVDAAINAAELDNTDESDKDSTSEAKSESEIDSSPKSESSVEAQELIGELQELDKEWSKIDRKLLYSVGQYHPDEYEETFGSLETALAEAGVIDKEATEEARTKDGESQRTVVDAETEDDVEEDGRSIASGEASSESVQPGEFSTLTDLTPNKRSSEELAVKIEDKLYAGAKKDAVFEVTDVTGKTVQLDFWSKHDLKAPDASYDWIVIEEVRLQEWEKDGETNQNLSSSSDTAWRKLDQGKPTKEGDLQEVNGVTDTIEQSLRESGFHMRDDLQDASPEEIAEADGVSKQVAMRIKLDVGG